MCSVRNKRNSRNPFITWEIKRSSVQRVFHSVPTRTKNLFTPFRRPLSHCQRDDTLGVSCRVYNERWVYAAGRSSGNEVMHSCNKLPGYLPEFPAVRHVSYKTEIINFRSLVVECRGKICWAARVLSVNCYSSTSPN